MNKIKLKFKGEFGGVYGVAFWLHFKPEMLQFDKVANLGTFDDVQAAIKSNDNSILVCSASLQGTKPGVSGAVEFMEIYFNVIGGGECEFYSTQESVVNAEMQEQKHKFEHLTFSSEFINVISYEIILLEAA